MKNVEIITGVILRADKHKEFDTRLTVLSPIGLHTFYAIGALRPTAKLKGALQLFNSCEFTVIGTKVTGAHVLHNAMGLTRDLNRFYLAGTIAQSVISLSKHGEIDGMSDITSQAITLLSDSEVACDEIFIWYFSKLITLLGFGEPEQSVSKIKQAFLVHLDFVIPHKTVRQI